MNPNLFSYFDDSVLAQARTILDRDGLRGFRGELLEDGRICLNGKYPDHFNFVDRARVIVSADGENLDGAVCDCTGRRAVSFCPHCAALLLRLEEAEPAARSSAAAEPEATPPEEAPENPAAEDPASADAWEASDAPSTAGEGDPGPVIQDLSYSFINCQAHLYPGNPNPEIPLERFTMVFGRNLIAKRLYQHYGEWGGSCFGMTTSSSLFYQPGNNVSVLDYRRGASAPRELKLSDRNRGLDLTLHSFIEAMQIVQMGQWITSWRDRTLRLPLPERLRLLCEKVEAFEANGTAPVLMEVYQNQRYYGGHAILPFRHERIDRFRSRLHIYDPNVPGRVRYCDLRQDSAGNYQSWRFLMCDNSEYSSDTGGVVSFLSHEVFQSAWDRRGTPQLPALFSTNNEDLSVQDEGGVEVLRISGGNMCSLREDVVPIRVTDMAASEGYALECWMNPGTYRVINEDPSRQLCFAFTGQNGEVEVETDAEEVGFTVNDEEETQEVKVKEKSELWARITDAARQILIRVVSSVAGSILTSIAGKLLLKYVTFDAVKSFQIDGQETDVTPYLYNEETEETEQTEEAKEDEAMFCTNKPLKPAEPAEPAEPADPDHPGEA